MANERKRAKGDSNSLDMKVSDHWKRFEKKVHKAKKHYENVVEDFFGDEIHSFRVEIKKLRAYIRLLNNGLNKNDQLKIDKKIKIFYHAAGQMRNIQLHKKRIEQLCENLQIEKPELYLQLLDNELVRQKELAKDAADKISWKDFEKESHDKLYGKLEKDFEERFLLLKEERLEVLIALPHYYDEALHEIRKILKDMLYNWDEILPGLRYTQLSKESIETITDKLGDFQDLHMALQLIGPDYTRFIVNQKERDALDGLKNELQRIKDEHKNSICHLLLNAKNEMMKDNVLEAVYEV